MHEAPPLENVDDTFPFALKTFAPQWGLRGIVLAGFLAAVMSTTSALTNATATIFSLDVYKKLINRQADDRQLVKAGRLAAGTALVAACIMAPQVERLGGIFRYFQTGVTYTAIPFISVILLGILWKRTNYSGALFGLIGGLVITLSFAIGFNRAGIELHWLYVGFLAQILTLSGIVIVSLMTDPPKSQQWEPFYWRPSLLSGYDDGVHRPWYKLLKLWFGIYAVIWLYLYWHFW